VWKEGTFFCGASFSGSFFIAIAAFLLPKEAKKETALII
jgi:hypothetical protein